MTEGALLRRRSPEIGESGYPRIDGDFYCSEPFIPAALVAKVRLRGVVLEPACGKGDISLALIAAGYPVWSRDLHNRGFGEAGVDFLTAPIPDCIRTVATNPPYRDELADAFVWRALDLMRPRRGLVCMLFSHRFDCAKSRADLFERHPAYRLRITLRQRPRWGFGNGNPKAHFAWHVWDFARLRRRGELARVDWY